MDDFKDPYTAFLGERRMLSGSPEDIALAVKRALEAGPAASILVIDNATGRPIDLDTSGSDDEVLARLLARSNADAPTPPSKRPRRLPFADAGSATSKPDDDSGEDGLAAPRGRGRPKLGVVAREVTLLPRHWEWLANQPGGASVALRRLVEVARRDVQKDGLRRSQERAYNFMSAMAGDLPGFEEAIRALFAHDTSTFERHMSGWPADIAGHAMRLASGAGSPHSA